MTKTKDRVHGEQLSLFRRGGFRQGAGRKPKGDEPLVPHAKRPRLTRHKAVLVTTHLVEDVPNLRRERTLVTLRRVLARGSDRFGFRLVEYGIQSNHLHLIAEADDARALSRGLQGLFVRIAKALNAEWGRRGKVFRDRYHARILSKPRHVRNALIYVLQNAKKHGAKLLGIDAFSSGPWFEGWRDRLAKTDRPIARAKSWVLKFGWRTWGLISTSDAPVGGREGVWDEFLDPDDPVLA